MAESYFGSKCRKDKEPFRKGKAQPRQRPCRAYSRKPPGRSSASRKANPSAPEGPEGLERLATRPCDFERALTLWAQAARRFHVRLSTRQGEMTGLLTRTSQRWRRSAGSCYSRCTLDARANRTSATEDRCLKLRGVLAHNLLFLNELDKASQVVVALCFIPA